MDDFEMLMTEAYDEGVVTEVIRPAAILPEDAARAVLVELAVRDVRGVGEWHATPTLWRRYDRPWDGVDQPGTAQLIGSMQVAYGTPTRYTITIYRCTITKFGQQYGWDVQTLCNEALSYGNLSLESCPRADLAPAPKPFRMPTGPLLPS